MKIPYGRERGYHCNEKYDCHEENPFTPRHTQVPINAIARVKVAIFTPVVRFPCLVGATRSGNLCCFYRSRSRACLAKEQFQSLLRRSHSSQKAGPQRSQSGEIQASKGIHGTKRRRISSIFLQGPRTAGSSSKPVPTGTLKEGSTSTAGRTTINVRSQSYLCNVVRPRTYIATRTQLTMSCCTNGSQSYAMTHCA